MSYSFTKKGITVTWDDGNPSNAKAGFTPVPHVAVITAHDGNPIIQVAPGASIRITSVTPAPTTSRNGSIYNCPGTREKNDHAVDARVITINGVQQTEFPPGYPVVTYPLHLVANDVLILTKSAPDWVGVNGYVRGSYFSENSRSTVSEMMAVSVVDWDVSADTPLRPPALGNSGATRAMRSIPLRDSSIDYAQLPSIINPASLGHSLPSLSYSESIFSDFGGQICHNWDLDQLQPALQHPGYGTWVMSQLSFALMHLCRSDLTTNQKKPLARSLVQWGADLAGAFADGRYYDPAGGHNLSAFWLIAFCGYMIHNPILQDPKSFFGGVGPWYEDRVCDIDPARPWYAPVFGPNWLATWRFKNQRSFSEPIFEGTLINTDPATWGDPNTGEHNTWAWAVNSYMAPTCGSQMGALVAFYLMGLRPSMKQAHIHLLEQWRKGIPGAGVTVLSGLLFTDFVAALTKAYAVGDGQSAVMEDAYTTYYVPLYVP